MLFVSTIVITHKHKFEVIDDVGTVKLCRLRPSGRASAHLAGGGAPPLLFAPHPETRYAATGATTIFYITTSKSFALLTLLLTSLVGFGQWTSQSSGQTSTPSSVKDPAEGSTTSFNQDVVEQVTEMEASQVVTNVLDSLQETPVRSSKF